MHCEELPTCENPFSEQMLWGESPKDSIRIFLTALFVLSEAAYSLQDEHSQYMLYKLGTKWKLLLSTQCQGLGSPVFDKLEALLAQAVMSIPASKGFEIGSGFAGERTHIVYLMKHCDPTGNPQCEIRNVIFIESHQNLQALIWLGVSTMMSSSWMKMEEWGPGQIGLVGYRYPFSLIVYFIFQDV